MHENHLNTDYIDLFQEGYSPVSLAFLDREQNARYQFYKNFPEKRLQVSFPKIEERDILIIGSYFAVNPALRKKVFELLQYAFKQKAIIYYDINFRQAHAWEKECLMNSFLENFRFASLVRCSEEDLNVLFTGKTIEDIYENILSHHCPNFIVTRGEKEIHLMTKSFRKKYLTKPVHVISTIGAGDSFNAGVIYGMTQDDSLQDFSLTKEKQWNEWINWGQTFASNVCESMENYVPENFLIKCKNNIYED
jgi:Sugar kinases, ribokinase family